jgi:hypothetical protein
VGSFHTSIWHPISSHNNLSFVTRNIGDFGYHVKGFKSELISGYIYIYGTRLFVCGPEAVA